MADTLTQRLAKQYNMWINTFVYDDELDDASVAAFFVDAIAKELCEHRVMVRCPYPQCERDADVGENVASWLRERGKL